MSIPHYVVDLDLPARNRWTHVIRDQRDSLIELSRSLKTIIKQQLGNTASKLHRSVLRPLCYWKSLPKEYSQELASIAKITGTYGLYYSDLVLFNISLDYLSKCTSAIFSTVHGQIHARNLDWELPFLKHLTIMVTFRKNGVDICKGITFAGCVGLLTVLHVNSNDPYSLAYNFRKSILRASKSKVLSGIITNYFKRGNISFLLRETCLSCNTYEDAFQFLREETLDLFSSGYITLCGVNISQGSMIAYGTRAHELYMSERIFVQTNHDLGMEGKFTEDREFLEGWADGDPVLLTTLSRKTMVLNHMKDRYHIRKEDITEIMSRNPVTNPYTIFTSIMIPCDGTLECTLP